MFNFNKKHDYNQYISIIYTNDTMSPSCSNESITTSKEPLLFLVIAHLRKLIAESFNFFASFLRRTQRLRGDSGVGLIRVIVK